MSVFLALVVPPGTSPFFFFSFPLSLSLFSSLYEHLLRLTTHAVRSQFLGEDICLFMNEFVRRTS